MSSQMLRPLNIGEILDAAFKLFLRHFKDLALAATVIALPLSIVSTLVIASSFPAAFEPVTFDTDTTTADPFGADPFGEQDPATAIAGVLVSYVLQIVGTVLVTGACFRIVSAGYLGSSSSWRESIVFALRRVHSLVWVGFLHTGAWVVGLLLCFVGAPWLYVLFALGTPVVLTEDIRGTKALRRSYGLVKDKWWHTFTVLIVAFGLTMVLTMIVGMLLSVLMFVGPQDPMLIAAVNALLSAVVMIASLPFGAAVYAIVYFDLRVRKEGFDLELLAQRIGAPPPVWQTQPVQQWPSGAPGEPQQAPSFLPPQSPSSPPPRPLQ